jgi:hypothetical protein
MSESVLRERGLPKVWSLTLRYVDCVRVFLLFVSILVASENVIVFDLSALSDLWPNVKLAGRSVPVARSEILELVKVANPA